MKTHLSLWVAIGLVVFLCGTPHAGAQNADLPLPPAGSAPKAGIPNLNGMWQGATILAENAVRQRLGGRLPPFTAYGQEKWDKRDLSFDPTGYCLPSGLGRIFHSPLQFQIIQSEDQVTFLFELYMQYHRVYTDGRKHPDNYEPTWWGHSLGRYEGNKLIVETAGMQDGTWLFTAGLQHSEKLRLTHTFEKTGPNTIRLTETFEDPVYFTEPWSITHDLQPGKNDFIEMVCMENNKDLNYFTPAKSK